MATLGELERVVMDVLWQRDTPATVRDVADDPAVRHLAYTTIMTVLDRLAHKELVRREKDGRAWRYSPAATRDAYITELMMQALDLTGDRTAALAHFARSMTSKEAKALRVALDNQHARRRPRP